MTTTNPPLRIHSAIDAATYMEIHGREAGIGLRVIHQVPSSVGSNRTEIYVYLEPRQLDKLAAEITRIREDHDI